jgi:hypothetical protein
MSKLSCFPLGCDKESVLSDICPQVTHPGAAFDRTRQQQTFQIRRHKKALSPSGESRVIDYGSHNSMSWESLKPRLQAAAGCTAHTPEPLDFYCYD